MTLREIRIVTIRDLIASRGSLTVYFDTRPFHCHNYRKLDLNALAERLGADHRINA